MMDTYRSIGVAAGVLFLGALLAGGWAFAENSDRAIRICRPVLDSSTQITLGRAGQFRWKCVDGEDAGNGYYIVFVRPNGTYVLLKVSRGRTSFEFTPDTEGVWRWIVINTDPDKTKPDIESAPGRFVVRGAEEPPN